MTEVVRGETKLPANGIVSLIGGRYCWRAVPLIAPFEVGFLLMWNVYLVDENGECTKVNSIPYSISDLAVFLAELDLPVASILLLPASG